MVVFVSAGGERTREDNVRLASPSLDECDYSLHVPLGLLGDLLDVLRALKCVGKARHGTRQIRPLLDALYTKHKHSPGYGCYNQIDGQVVGGGGRETSSSQSSL